MDAGFGGPPGSPAVAVSGPRANESFYPTQSIQLGWTATDAESPEVRCSVVAIGSSMIPIATDVATTSGVAKSATWSINGAPAGTYRIQVSCTDTSALTGVGISAAFQVSAPPQQVAYAQVQALWTRSCTSMQCHDATGPQGGMNLTASASYGQLVGKASEDCPSYKRVEAGAPDRSYVVMKLQGSGPCFIGSKMPKSPYSMSAAEIQLVRDWIVNGAPM